MTSKFNEPVKPIPEKKEKSRWNRSYSEKEPYPPDYVAKFTLYSVILVH